MPFVSKNCIRLFSERIFQLERNMLKNAQCHRRELLGINPVPTSINNDVLEGCVCKALSLSGHDVILDNLQACHHLKKKYTVSVKLKCRTQKRNILINRKNLLINQMFSPNLTFLVGSSFRRACITRTISIL